MNDRPVYNLWSYELALYDEVFDEQCSVNTVHTADLLAFSFDWQSKVQID